jgi:hypothetical protein
VVAEQHGGRQPHQAAADDQDGDFLVGHGATLARPATTYKPNSWSCAKRRFGEPSRVICASLVLDAPEAT